MTFDIILLTDTSFYPKWTRGYGAHRLASHLRSHNYSVLVLDFSSALTMDYWQQICQCAVGDHTRLIGFSSTWWPYREPFGNNDKVNPSPDVDDWLDDDNKVEYETKDTLTYDAVRGNLQRWIDVPKLINPKIKTLLGGAKVDYYKDMPVDHFMAGLSEVQILDFLQDKRRLWPKLIRHDDTATSRDWGWTTCSTQYTEYDLLKPNELLTLEVARGCRFKCAFCTFALIGRKDVAAYTKTEETVYEELMHNYTKWGSTSYWLADDTLNDNTEKLEMLARVAKRLPFEVKFKAYVRLDLIPKSPDHIQLLYDAGVRSCFIGVESFHPVAAKAIGKGMSAEKRKQAIYKMREVWGDKVTIFAGYIVGLPGEDEEFLREQAEWFASENCPVDLTFFWPLHINVTSEGDVRTTSEIERNPGKFGYRMTDPSKPSYWERDDGIKTLTHARQLMQEFSAKIFEKEFKGDKISDDLGIQDPVTEYFIPLIQKLKQ